MCRSDEDDGDGHLVALYEGGAEADPALPQYSLLHSRGPPTRCQVMGGGYIQVTEYTLCTHCVHTVYQRVIMPIEDQSRVVFSQCKTFYYGGASARNQEG